MIVSRASSASSASRASSASSASRASEGHRRDGGGGLQFPYVDILYRDSEPIRKAGFVTAIQPMNIAMRTGSKHELRQKSTGDSQSRLCGYAVA